MDQIADLQAQVVALRLSVEGIWMSLLRSGPDALIHAERMRAENTAALDQLDASTPQARAARDAIIGHSEHLWGSIIWQLQQATRGGSA